jgi:hypothetical protein
MRPLTSRLPLATTVMLVAAAIVSAQGTSQPVQDPSLPQVLARAADYVRQLHAQLSGIVADETYLQELRSTADSSFHPLVPSRRALKSDLLLVKPAHENRYVEYRDVYEVDGVAVRDRQERLTALFLAPGASTRRQLGAIINESARHNIGDIPRNINTPMLTLSFLLPDRQRRFRFRVLREAQPELGTRRDDGGDPTRFRATAEMWTIAFREVGRPTVIRTNHNRDFPAAGRLWINPHTGAVLMSELQMDSRRVAATINVSYQSEPLLGFLVPAEMRERYQAGGLTVEGRATYDNFRQFQVRTQEVIGKPRD